MTAVDEYIAAIRNLHRAAQIAVVAAEAIESDDTKSLKLTAHFIACVADNLHYEETRQ